MVRVPVTVEPVEARTQLRRFAEIPYVLHHGDERWSPPVRAFDQWRLDARRHPYFDRGDAAYLLARRGGRPVGRIAAHVSGPGVSEGHFGFFALPDDAAVADALVGRAVDWLRGRGVTSMTGPVSWRPDEELGVVVHGHQHRGVTGRPWQPAWYARQLRSAGLVPGGRRHSHRLATADAADAADAADDDRPTRPSGEEPPPQAGRYADPALVLDGIAAVPDVSAALARASLRNAWRVARMARERAFDTAVCVRWAADPAESVPRLLTAAADAGYRWLLAPWAPDGPPPETTHQVFQLDW